MAPKILARTALGLATGLLALAMMPTAFAQDSFKGTWKIVEVTKPDWTEPTAQPQGMPMSVGDTVEFREGSVISSGELGCATAEYKIGKTNQAELFQRSISVANSAADIAAKFSLQSNSRSLLVECDNGLNFEFYEDAKGRVVTLFDSLVYTLERTR